MRFNTQRHTHNPCSGVICRLESDSLAIITRNQSQRAGRSFTLKLTKFVNKMPPSPLLRILPAPPQETRKLTQAVKTVTDVPHYFTYIYKCKVQVNGAMTASLCFPGPAGSKLQRESQLEEVCRGISETTLNYIVSARVGQDTSLTQTRYLKADKENIALPLMIKSGSINNYLEVFSRF